MDIFQYAKENNADYLDMNTFIIYHVQEYNKSKEFGLPTKGIRYSRDGKTIGYVMEPSNISEN